jgi:hypothetical protein
MRHWIVFFILAFLLGNWGLHHHAVDHLRWCLPTWPGVVVPDEPIQTDIQPGEESVWQYKGCTFTALAHYDIKGRVLHRMLYFPSSSDGMASVCPIDLGLGWGRMSDSAVYGQLEIGQVSRHLAWQPAMFTTEVSIPEREIELHISNNHLIPANADVSAKLYTFGYGDIVHLVGYLVAISNPEWSGEVRSSLTRTDVGDGACEVMWVSQAERIGR